ncbi:MAG: NADH-quinone oxidoreductase subunit NuoK [Sumerlaeia bacterium]
MSPFLIYTLVLSVTIFSIGVVGMIIKRNAISLFMNVELMLNAANLGMVAFATHYGLLQAGALVVFIMTVAAAEAAVGLAIFIAIFRSRQHIRVDELDLLKG